MTTVGEPETDVMTITRFVIEQLLRTPHATGELASLVAAIVTCVKAITLSVSRVGIDHETHDAEEIEPKDVNLNELANNIFINILRATYATCIMVSAKSDGLIEISLHDQGKYVVCFDPLDGKTDTNIHGPMGSCFCIYRRKPDPQPNSCTVGEPTKKVWPCLQDVLQTGRQIVCGGYCLYGCATLMVLSVGHGVNEFMLDPTIGEFILTKQDVRMEPRGNYYSINEGQASLWNKALTQYVHEKKFPKSGKPYSSRYIGSVVADAHRTIKYGGILLYPNVSEAEKLKLVYLCNPIAYIVEQAGGKATNGVKPILDVQPVSIHESTDIYIGSAEDVDDVMRLLQAFKPHQ